MVMWHSLDGIRNSLSEQSRSRMEPDPVHRTADLTLTYSQFG
jgi:hypothetical protein